METVGIAVLGAGHMGSMHARVIASHPFARLSAVADLRLDVAARVAGQYGAKALSNVDDILNDDDIEACVVALPDVYHVEATCRLLEAGKSVLVEKPVAHTLDAANEIRVAAEKGPGRLMTGHLLRFDPRFNRAAELVREGHIGEVLEVRALRLGGHPGERARGSSTRFLVGIHDMDAIQWIVGSEVTEVFARSRVDVYPEYQYGIDDVVHCSLLFANGAIGSLTYGWTLPSKSPWRLVAGIELTGTKGSIHLTPTDNSLLAVGDVGAVYQDSYYWPVVGDTLEGDIARELDHFISSVATGSDFKTDLAGPLAAVALSDAIERSLRSGGTSVVETVHHR